jgi:hypothetical protein
MRQGNGREQVTGEDGEGKMTEAGDSASHAIVVDILMGT